MLTEMLPDPSPLLFLMADSRPQPTLLIMRTDLLLRLPTLVVPSILLNQLLGMAMLLLPTNLLPMLDKEGSKTVIYQYYEVDDFTLNRLALGGDKEALDELSWRAEKSLVQSVNLNGKINLF